MGSTPTSDNVEDLSQYDPVCVTGRKTPNLTLTRPRLVAFKISAILKFNMSALKFHF